MKVIQPLKSGAIYLNGSASCKFRRLIVDTDCEHHQRYDHTGEMTWWPPNSGLLGQQFHYKVGGHPDLEAFSELEMS
ncbi:hypothetical protein MLD38_030569 [Melastoma candidum]|uniref:Uncharacterized protein n=1 Tax=Melastoma candidum TaxID=119954 RepID=A0ACB9MM54_9MYRT|nr:hypothetical protein MLD38_030569 [Melastoma candidum]